MKGVLSDYKLMLLSLNKIYHEQQQTLHLSHTCKHIYMQRKLSIMEHSKGNNYCQIEPQEIESSILQ